MMYEKYRNEIKDGDVILYEGTSFISKLIRMITKSSYSHAGLAVWWHGRLMVMEATKKGVYPLPMSKNIAHYKGNVRLFTSVKPIPQTKRLYMVKFAQGEIGKEYSRWRLILFGYILILGKKRDERDLLRKENTLICSHYVAQTYNYAGIDLKEGVSDSFTSPQDIANSPSLHHKFALKLGE